VPAYHVIFITQQQATAVGSIEARARLNAVLAGVDEATMRRLTNEAYADLVTQLQAANISVVPAGQARALANGVEAVPGNGDARGDAVVADVAAWEELVRQAYRAFNQALVAEIVEARG